MKTTTQNNAAMIQATATATATALWQVTVDSTIALAETIADCVNATAGDYPLAGAAIGKAWHEIGANVAGGCVARNLVAGCYHTNMDRADCLKLANAAGIVSRQRVSQLVAVIYDGDNSKNCGKKKTATTEPTGASDSEPSEGGGFTAAQICNAIASAKLTAEEILQIIAAASAKLAK